MGLNEKMQKLVVDAGQHEAEVSAYMGGLQAALLPVQVRNMIKRQAEITKRLAEALGGYIWEV